MPSDEDVVKAVKENDLKRDALTILYLLESKVNDTFQSSERDNSYNTFVREQVMPERADDNWPLGLGYNPEQRKDIAKTLGNFVILREKLKSKAKSAKWTEKRNAMRAGVVDLSLFQAIENNLPSWDETTIEERNKWIAGKVRLAEVIKSEGGIFWQYRLNSNTDNSSIESCLTRMALYLFVGSQ